MNETLINILSVLVSAILLPLITLIGKALIHYLSTRTEVEKIKQKVSVAHDAVMRSVEMVYQTYVQCLKEAGAFNENKHQSAFQKAADNAKALIPEETKQLIEMLYSDFEIWLKTAIEASVKQLKAKKLKNIPQSKA